ncbi:aldose epimerase family protein [Mucilaginibacter boryungensis]|uniref:Aldose 1-epimerase n=1 Tax=Mucilaginibacter boryungensis TaxID=768480 RepID=A0ABR9XD89_9SPHI|nr:aldose epimerase family protein [Mucilaginibacter boryungensis]MBE9665206.1 galactose mutarotase [Mucilaginibacter boryungensis]
MPAKFITLKNKHLQVTITNYGARLVGLLTLGKDGTLVDVVAGFKTVDEYEQATSPYYGATIGRFANRIAKGRFSLNGISYMLPVNNGPNCLHGGGGIHAKVWDILDVQDQSITMQLYSPNGEDGFPGNVYITVTYMLADNAVVINYEATTDKDTIINLTNHAYFNLNGEGDGDILGHTLQINADSYTPVTQNLIPTGELGTVAHSPFDFRTAKPIGKDIGADHEQLIVARGYDHNYVLNRVEGQKLTFAAKAIGDKTGIAMAVDTTEPGMQFYTGNFMDGTNTFKGGSKDDFRSTFCLETQHFPDSPNQPAFPSTLLSAGQVFRSSSVYRFGVVE